MTCAAVSPSYPNDTVTTVLIMVGLVAVVIGLSVIGLVVMVGTVASVMAVVMVGTVVAVVVGTVGSVTVVVGTVGSVTVLVEVPPPGLVVLVLLMEVVVVLPLARARRERTRLDSARLIDELQGVMLLILVITFSKSACRSPCPTISIPSTTMDTSTVCAHSFVVVGGSVGAIVVVRASVEVSVVVAEVGTVVYGE